MCCIPSPAQRRRAGERGFFFSLKLNRSIESHESRLLQQVAGRGFIDTFLSPKSVALPTQFPFRRRSPGPLFPRPRRSLSGFLSFAREPSRHLNTRAGSPFRATLAAVSLRFVRVPFTRPVILWHSAPWTNGSAISIESWCCSRHIGFHKSLFS